jgi:NAD(P)-dependent dehydrogenase (short-subunit alcohol dehydrogenase family)
MDLGLKGSLALVSGGTAGIGKATAVQLLREGARVIVNGRDEARLARTIAELRPLGEVHGAAGDLSKQDGADKVIGAARAAGEIDILINNAGAYPSGAFADLSDADWLALFQTNVMSAVRLSRAFLPGMLARNRGRIIMLGSEQSTRPDPTMLHYSMTKAAIVSLGRGLAELTKDTAVTVNSVLAGYTWTEGTGADGSATDAGRRAAIRKSYFQEGDGRESLIQRVATAQEVADLIVFLCSARASAINGAAQRAEGGIIRTMM